MKAPRCIANRLKQADNIERQIEAMMLAVSFLVPLIQCNPNSNE